MTQNRDKATSGGCDDRTVALTKTGPWPRTQRLWRDVGDDSPWFEKALFHAIAALKFGDDPAGALEKIERVLGERPSEVATTSSGGPS